MIVGSNVIDLEAAVIGAVALIGAATVPALFSVRNGRRLGKPNGSGNVVEMLTTAMNDAKEAKLLSVTALADVRHNQVATEQRLDDQDAVLAEIKALVTKDEDIP